MDQLKPEAAPQHYDVAISFAGENRAIADYFAKRLDASGYSVFYDDFEADRLWGSDLPVEFGRVYGEQSRYCLMIVSHHYLQKMWTNHERQHAIARLMQKGDSYILPLKIDDSEIPGLPSTIGYISLTTRPKKDVYGILLSKLGRPLAQKHRSAHVSLEDRDLVREIIQSCYRRALFTKMDSEINLAAMFDSLAKALGNVQKAVSQIHDPGIQHIALGVIEGLDSIERFHQLHGTENFSLNMLRQYREELDTLKLRVINVLLELRRVAGISIQLPTALTAQHFFSLEDADAPPERLF